MSNPAIAVAPVDLVSLFEEIEDYLNRPRCSLLWHGEVCPLCGAEGTSLLPEYKRRCRAGCAHDGCPGYPGM